MHVLGLNILTLLSISVSYFLHGGSIEASAFVRILLYIAILLTTHFVHKKTLAIGLHAGLVAYCIFVLPDLPGAVMLVPFHLSAILEWKSSYEYFVASALIVSTGIVHFFVTGSAEPAFYIWTIAVFFIHRVLALHTRRNAGLEDRIANLENEITGLERSTRSSTQSLRAGDSLSRLEERHTVATELHDQLGHMVAGSLFQLEAARIVAVDEPDRAVEMIARTESVLKEGMDSIRRSLHDLDPVADEIGIRRIERSMYDFEREGTIEAGLDVDGDIEVIRPALWKVMHENIVEALTNCAKHSDASRIDISIDVLPGIIKLQVLDNGKPARSPVRFGMGLGSIEERTVRTGGIMTVDTSNGFSIVCLWRR